MNKYLVFALERRIDSGHPTQDQLVQQCFELVGVFHFLKKGVKHHARRGAVEFAGEYSKDNKVRTLVVKGTVFEG